MLEIVLWIYFFFPTVVIARVLVHKLFPRIAPNPPFHNRAMDAFVFSFVPLFGWAVACFPTDHL